MTFILLLALVLVAVLALGVGHWRNSGTQSLGPRPAGALRVATYNVHYIVTFRAEGAWSMADWEDRKRPLDMAFKAMDADVIGFQEMESFGGRSQSDTNLTLDWLLAENPGYGAAAVGDPAVFPSTQPILFRRDRLRVLDQGWFFFSETPDVIYSRTFNGSFPAFASWAVFEDQSGAVFRVVNLHTDFRSRSNRLRSIELVAQRIAPWQAAGESVMVIGDFNGRLGDRSLRILEDQGVVFAPVKGATYHLNRGLNLFSAIDHVGVSGPVGFAGEPVVLRQKFGGRWPTDHYPLIVDVALAAP